MAKLKINHGYTKDEIDAIIQSRDADKLKLKGYVLRAQGGLIYIIPAKDATAQQRKARSYTTSAFGELPIITKRKPADRVDALMLKWIEDAKAAGTIPGISDAEVSKIVGEAWKTGRTEVTTEMVKTVARHFLEKAEKDRARANYKRTVSI